MKKNKKYLLKLVHYKMHNYISLLYCMPLLPYLLLSIFTCVCITYFILSAYYDFTISSFFFGIDYCLEETPEPEMPPSTSVTVNGERKTKFFTESTTPDYSASNYRVTESGEYYNIHRLTDNTEFKATREPAIRDDHPFRPYGELHQDGWMYKFFKKDSNGDLKAMYAEKVKTDHTNPAFGLHIYLKMMSSMGNRPF